MDSQLIDPYYLMAALFLLYIQEISLKLIDYPFTLLFWLTGWPGRYLSLQLSGKIVLALKDSFSSGE